MKKILTILSICFLMSSTSFAAPGDTTWVQANLSTLSYYGNYDTSIVFPTSSTTYRKILMIFKLGKYACGGTGYCGDWDYTVQNFLIKPSGETFELGRLITPYANAGAPRTPWSWKQNYVFDVTDYASKLRDTAKIRILYSGYSGGFTGDIRFAFIEGTPERNVLELHRLWNGSFNYGDTSRSDSFNINTRFTARNETAPAGTQAVNLKFTVTGHGADGTGCSEFCSKYYKVLVNGSPVITRNIWRDNCGINDLYPQSGTWIYDRGNWCPGASVNSHHNMLPGITGGTSFNTSIEFENYIRSGSGTPSYTTDAAIIYYGAINKTLDASLERIISPNIDENSFRSNPTCGNPVILVRNTGSTTITSMVINYGVQDSTVASYTWTGSLPALTDTMITLPLLPELTSVAGATGNFKFNVTIAQVNSATDNDATNNALSSSFIAAPKWPATIKMVFRTNSQAVSIGSTVNETSWAIYDMSNTIVASRTNANLNTTYTDTVSLAANCYKLVITDAGCDGLQWWPFASSGITSGYLNVRRLPNTNINMNGYSYTGTYNNDFGCSFTQYFYVAPFATSITDLDLEKPQMLLFPNPTQNELNIDLQNISNPEGTIVIMDALGRIVYQTKTTQYTTTLSTESLSNGLYTVQYFTNQGANKLQSRLIIAH